MARGSVRKAEDRSQNSGVRIQNGIRIQIRISSPLKLHLVIFNGATAEDIMGKKFKDGAHIRFDLDVASPESEGGVTTLHITMSGGLATLEEGEKLTDAIDRADKALYWAKNNGRDRIALAPPMLEETAATE